mmetsp:Transcript_37305/g.111733  ORF Transcript_37305/g.111733 Transcript_37305/m.111733 type:complete len:326 (+) Transcript_37305:724-1701(+)
MPSSSDTGSEGEVENPPGKGGDGVGGGRRPPSVRSTVLSESLDEILRHADKDDEDEASFPRSFLLLIGPHSMNSASSVSKTFNISFSSELFFSATLTRIEDSLSFGWRFLPLLCCSVAITDEREESASIFLPFARGFDPPYSSTNTTALTSLPASLAHFFPSASLSFAFTSSLSPPNAPSSPSSVSSPMRLITSLHGRHQGESSTLLHSASSSARLSAASRAASRGGRGGPFRLPRGPAEAIDPDPPLPPPLPSLRGPPAVIRPRAARSRAALTALSLLDPEAAPIPPPPSLCALWLPIGNPSLSTTTPLARNSACCSCISSMSL